MNFQEAFVHRTKPSVKQHSAQLPDFLSPSIKMGLVPAVFFFLSFVVLTFPAITKFSTHFLTDAGDGLQNVWNIWWVEKAIAGLQSPWQTNYLYFPFGVSLLGQTLNPFNGFVAIPLSTFLDQVSVFNIILIFSFVASGLTAFFLAYHLTAAYIPSLAAGFIFTFSNYHFMHAEGHLQLVSMEWIPLFVLFWLKLLSKPSIGVAIAAAVALFLVILCDYYYFFYCVLTGIIMLGWHAFRERRIFFLIKPPYLVPLVTFCIIALLTSGVLAGSLLLLNLRDPLEGFHSAEQYGVDLLSPFIYGAHWRFGSLTQGYWEPLGEVNENSVYLGFSVIILLIFTWRKRSLIGKNEINMFFLILLIFFVLALGPSLHIWGQRIPLPLPLPYDWLVRAFPPLKSSGCAVRMMAMVIFCAAMISAYGFKQLCKEPRGRVFATLLFALLVVEDLPTALPMTEPIFPPYVTFLKNLSGQDGVLDTTFSNYNDSMLLLYQTFHEKPTAHGFVSRLPASVANKDQELQSAIAQGDLPRLWREFHLKYLVSSDLDITAFVKSFNGSGKISIIWTDGQTSVIDLSESNFKLVPYGNMAPIADIPIEAQGVFVKDGYYPDTERLAVDTKVMGSWSQSDDATGSVRFGPFRTGDYDAIALPFVTGPVSNGLSIAVVNARNGKTVAQLSSPTAIQNWRLWRIPLPERDMELEVVAQDQGPDWGEWLAVGLPRSFQVH